MNRVSQSEWRLPDRVHAFCLNFDLDSLGYTDVSFFEHEAIMILFKQLNSSLLFLRRQFRARE